MPKISHKTQEKIQHLQILEQNLQNILLQKQAFKLESSETENALKEVENSKQEVYRLIGQVMLKSSKTDIEKELKQKKEILDIRVKSIEKQEQELARQSENLKQEVMKEIN